MIDWNGSFVETEDLTIHYVRAGRGVPIVLLHGWPEHCRTWMHNIPPLAQHYDVIAPDLRGFGRTRRKGPPPPGGTPPDVLAHDLLALCDRLGLARIAIVSHDVGAFVAQFFAHLAPERVAALFFFNVPYPGIGGRWFAPGHLGEIWYQSFHQKDFAAALVGSSREATRLYLRHFLTHWAYDKNAFEPYLEEWVDNFRSNDNLQGGFDWYRGVAAYRAAVAAGTAPTRPKIAAPAMALWGRHDPVIKVEWADRLGDYFERIELRVAEQAGHFVHFEQPDLANRTMLEFLARTCTGA